MLFRHDLTHCRFREVTGARQATGTGVSVKRYSTATERRGYSTRGYLVRLEMRGHRDSRLEQTHHRRAGLGGEGGDDKLILRRIGHCRPHIELKVIYHSTNVGFIRRGYHRALDQFRLKPRED